MIGYRAIKRKEIEKHKKLMISAFVVSCVFLVSYLIHKYFAGTTHFREDLGHIRTAYLLILGSHVILAMSVPPLAITTIVLGLKDKRDKHRRLARWTFPIWIYVSVTGVVVYLMIYQLWPPG